MKYNEVIDLCELHLGVDWEDYFYSEFVQALVPWTEPFNTLVRCLKSGWTDAEISLHPNYGIYINLAGYHPRMEDLLKYFPPAPISFLATEKCALDGWTYKDLEDHRLAKVERLRFYGLSRDEQKAEKLERNRAMRRQRESYFASK